MRIDLNADVGESFGTYAIGDDPAVMRSVTSVSVAAGFHGGDPTVLRRTIRLARELGVAVGAHPGFPDLAGFGRREMRFAPGELEDLVLYQIAAVAGVAGTEGLALQHVKPHGALYNMAVTDTSIAEAIVRAVAAFRPAPMLCALPGSALAAAAQAAGLHVMREGYADRAYSPDGSLVPRGTAGAVITSVEDVVMRAIEMVTDGVVTAVDGTRIRVAIDTLCIHGDTPGAPSLAAWLRAGLTSAGVDVQAPGS